MSRQHATPVLLADDGAFALTPLPLGGGPEQISEADLQQLIHNQPACLPIAEIDPLFCEPVPLCRELNTAAGPIDNLLVTPSGLPVLVECKLWRNPEARRHVVGQILDYAKQLTRWTASDLQREVARQVGGDGNPILRLLAEAGHEVDEITFNDALTHNLRRGRFLLLIVGDGIREGVEAIAEYLQVHAGLHFSLGLVELPVFVLPAGERLVVPRVLARTTLITREVITIPEGHIVQDYDPADSDPDEPIDDGTAARVAFMRELVAFPLGLDPDQPAPRVSEKGWLFLYLPAPASSCWVSVLFKEGGRRVGVRLSSNINTIGEAAIRQAVQDWPSVANQLGGEPVLREQSPGRFVAEELRLTAKISDPAQRKATLEWLRGRVRDFVGVFRPRIRDAVEAMKE